MTINFTDTDSFTTPNFNGEDGSDGNGITDIVDNEDGTLTINFTDTDSFTTPNFNGEDGSDGNGITDIVDNEDGTLTINFTNTDPLPPNFNGEDGSDGNGITDIEDNEDGTLTINFTETDSFTTPNFNGEDGDPGADGEDGADAVLRACTAKGLDSVAAYDDDGFVLTWSQSNRTQYGVQINTNAGQYGTFQFMPLAEGVGNERVNDIAGGGMVSGLWVNTAYIIMLLNLVTF